MMRAPNRNELQFTDLAERMVERETKAEQLAYVRAMLHRWGSYEAVMHELERQRIRRVREGRHNVTEQAALQGNRWHHPER